MLPDNYPHSRGLCLKGQPVDLNNYSYKKNDSDRYSYIDSKANLIIENVKDLIDDPKYKPYFYKKLYEKGPVRFMELADEARKHGVDKGRYFVKLLKTQQSQVTELP